MNGSELALQTSTKFDAKIIKNLENEWKDTAWMGSHSHKICPRLVFIKDQSRNWKMLFAFTFIGLNWYFEENVAK